MKLFHPFSFILLATLLPGIKGQCETELGAVGTCIANLGESEAQGCGTCLENVPDVSTVDTCEELESTICSYLSGCETSCGTCIDEVESYLDCIASDCGGVDCGTTTEPPDSTEPPDDAGSGGQCDTELGFFTTCVANLGESEAQACGTCFDNFPVGSTVDTCEELESIFCGALSACETSCGTCIDEAESYLDCSALSDTECGGINCGTTTEPPDGTEPPDDGGTGGSGGTGSSGGSIRMGTVLGSFFTGFLGLVSLLLV